MKKIFIKPKKFKLKKFINYKTYKNLKNLKNSEKF